MNDSTRNSGVPAPPSIDSSVRGTRELPQEQQDFLLAAPSVTLPQGGGAISGIGETFKANPVTGTADLAVPLPSAPGRNGRAPALALRYSSGAGNGPFGVGWSVDIPSIRRKTERGLPRYRDAGVSGEDSDTFQLAGAEDLVPALVESGGSWVADTRWDSGYFVRRYRPRTEGAYTRIERWIDPSDGSSHWRTLSGDNTWRIFGQSASARLADPDDSSRVFEWMLEEVWDELGNGVLYTYKAEDRAGVTTTHPWEAQRSRTGHGCAWVYPKAVYWGNGTPATSGDWMFRLVFDYGEHDTSSPTPTEANTWSARQDPFSRYRAGFDTRCHRLCQRVLLFHDFTELSSSGPVITRSLELSYEASSAFSRLASVTARGWVDDNGSWDTDTLPPLEFTYQDATVAEQLVTLTGVEDLPAVASPGHAEWVDLDGDGLPGLLCERAGAWFYKRNEGSGQLGRARRLSRIPSLGRAGGRLVDLTGSGRPALVRHDAHLMGFHEQDPDGAWRPFRAFRQVPNINWSDPNLRWIDLDGDGRADLLLAEDHALRWYPSDAEQGFQAEQRAPRFRDEAEGPVVVFAQEGETVFLADMSGDGLADIVRVRPGQICYWPNRGYGRFGAKVVMGSAPRFDHPDRFDPRRVRLADIDGSGPADLIYLGPDHVRCWFNQSGNNWGAPTTLSRIPGVDDASQIQLADVFGEGTACLVWSSSLPGDAGAPLKALRLMSEGKPHLLSTLINNMGRETRVTYAPSTQFYLSARQAGTPWATRLPFPVHCVERVTSLDHVTGWRFVSLSAYHHGYYDGPEREFRGFGLVEQQDTESFSDWADSDSSNDALAYYVDPVRTRTWFHTGAWRQQSGLEAAYAAEYFDGDSSAAWPGRAKLPSGLDAQGLREAHRALRGVALRSEVYSEDGSADAATPYSVSQTRVQVIQVQPAQDGHPGVWQQIPLESMARHYERDASDPRTTHQIVLAHDDLGRPVQTAAVAYPRRSPATGLTTEQGATHVVVSQVELFDDDSSDDVYHLGLMEETLTWELGGLSGDDTDPLTVADFPSDLSAVTEVDFEDALTTGTQKRKLSHTRVLYWNDGLTAALTAGSVGARALVYERYLLAMTDGLISDVHGTDVSSTDLTNAGYVQHNSDWWIPSGRTTHDSANFYRVNSVTDPFGNSTTLSWDSYSLLVESVTDAVGNVVSADNDYRLLGPWKSTDPNGHAQALAFDALGRVTAMAIIGANSEGDTLADPTVEYSYDHDRYQTSGVPNRAHVRSRETHADSGTGWLEQYVYSDGGGNVVQTKQKVAPGDAPERDTNGDLVFDGNGDLQWASADPRWVGTGRTVVNNKGHVVQQYEPFFSSTSDYEDEVELVEWGVTPVFWYDPLGRNVRTVLPDGNERSVTFTPWQVSHYDEEDNLTSGDHEDTPAVMHLDSLGRVVLSVVTPDGTTDHETRVTLDIQGNTLTVNDARGNDIQERVYDLLGRPLFTGAADEGYDGSSGDGETRVLFDVAHQPLKTWRSGSLTLRRVYDDLRRPRELYVDEGSGESLVELTIYGDELTDSADASAVAADNLKGRPYQVYDTAGRVTLAYDFKGLITEQTRTLIDDITTDADWSGLETKATIASIDSWVGTNGGLSSEDYTVETSYDAVGRVTEQTAPDSSVTTPGYDEGGRLTSVEVNIRGATTATTFVDEITYNARGQRLSISYGNNTSSTYTYDDERLWLDTVQTTRSTSSSYGGATLQSLTFTRDAVGNITQIADAAQETLFFSNTQVTPTRSFTYDSLYRLTEATGREKVSQTQTTAWYVDYASGMGGVPDSTTTALRRYTQVYTYDATGNITEMKHKNGSGTVLWRRACAYETTNNQLTGHNGPSEAPDNDTTWTPSFSYNARGAMTFLPHLKTGVSANLTRDFRDQIRKADLDNSGNVAWFAYDAGGQRVRKLWDKGAIEEERIYIGGYEVWRKRSSGTLQDERETLHVMDGAQRIAMVETKTVSGGSTVSSPTNRQRYQYSDHLGTVSLETDDDGGVITYEEYHPYGSTAWWAEKSGIQVSRKRYRYTGKEKDEETGLCYHGHRYYMPWLGRWERADPIGLGDGVNRFRYVSNRPVRLIDPDGTSALGVLMGLISEAGAPDEPQVCTPPPPPIVPPGQGDSATDLLTDYPWLDTDHMKEVAEAPDAHFMLADGSNFYGTEFQADVELERRTDAAAARQMANGAAMGPLGASGAIVGYTLGGVQGGGSLSALWSPVDHMLLGAGLRHSAPLGVPPRSEAHSITKGYSKLPSKFPSSASASPVRSGPFRVYNRRESPSMTATQAALIEASGELLGRGYRGQGNTISVFVGPLPPGAIGVEIMTNARPTRTDVGTIARFSPDYLTVRTIPTPQGPQELDFGVLQGIVVTKNTFPQLPDTLQPLSRPDLSDVAQVNKAGLNRTYWRPPE